MALVLVAAGLTARAQYRGGVGDGYHASGVSTISLNGTNPNSPAYFASASGGDGHDASGRVNVMLTGTPLPVTVYRGGGEGADGYDSSGLSNRILSGASLPVAVYKGSPGGGDGYDALGVINRRLDGAADFTAAYSGSAGGGDGYDSLGVEEIAIDSRLAYNFVFSGGVGDGYDSSGIRNKVVSGTPEDPSPYLASSSGGDGYDVSGSTYNRLDGFVLSSAIYEGSPSGADGYDVSGTAFVNISGAPHFSLSYLGDTGDGYDDEGRRNTYLDPAHLPPVAVYRGHGGDGYDVAFAPYVFYMGAGGAASPMTYNVWRFINFTPEESNDGRDADGADLDLDGLPNLLEYAVGSDPRVPDAAIYAPQFYLSNLSDFGFSALPDRHLTAVVHRNPRIFDATLTVEINDDLLSLWDTSDIVPVNSTPSLLIVRDRLGVSAAPHRLMRLRASLAP